MLTVLDGFNRNCLFRLHSNETHVRRNRCLITHANGMAIRCLLIGGPNRNSVFGNADNGADGTEYEMGRPAARAPRRARRCSVRYGNRMPGSVFPTCSTSAEPAAICEGADFFSQLLRHYRD